MWYWFYHSEEPLKYVTCFLIQQPSFIEGVNWYSILRAEKTSSTEAIVLAVMVDKDDLFSLAVLISLAEYLSSKETC